LSRSRSALVLLVGGLLVGVILSEVGFRVARRFVCTGQATNRLWEVDSEFGWAHRPHAAGWLWHCRGREFEWRVFSRINAQGLRDVEHAYAKPAGTTRILLLGDSVTEAVQVPLEQTFARHLEAGLRARGATVEVVNAGVVGYGTDSELLFFRGEAYRYDPDLVLLVFNLQNDVLENSPALYGALHAATRAQLWNWKPFFRLDADGRLLPIPAHGVPAGFRSRLPDALERNLYVLRASRRLLALDDAPPAVAPKMIFELNSVPLPAVWSDAWTLTEALIRELRAEVERRGMRLQVAVMPAKEHVAREEWDRYAVLIPALAQGAWDLEGPPRRIESFLTREGIPHLSLLPALRAHHQATGSTGFFVSDVHLAEDGHQVVAEELVAFLEPIVRARARRAGRSRTGAR
jgi:lysophospholipase L1-like esterase